MYYRNALDKTGECSRMGEFAELTFGSLLSQKGKVRIANRSEQMNHIDFILTHPDGKQTKYDVKARKRVSRSDNSVSDDRVWIEFLNINGDFGWLYGHSDYLVFERNEDFLIVSRLVLQKFAEEKCDLKQMVTSSSNALYVGYRRAGRGDLLSMVKTSDIAKIAQEIWSKVSIDKSTSPC